MTLKKTKKTKEKSTKLQHAYLKNIYGVKNWHEASEWLAFRGIEDIECITPDQAGVARGKMMPSNKFTSDTSLALPSAVFMVAGLSRY